MLMTWQESALTTSVFLSSRFPRSCRTGSTRERFPAKMKKQTVVHLRERPTVGKEQNDGNDAKPDPIGNNAENHDDREREQSEIEKGSRQGHGRFVGTAKQNRFARQKETATEDQGNREQKRREHDPQEFPVGDVEMGIEIEVLRVAERREHSAEVGGNVLQDENGGHIPFGARGNEDEIAERKKGQESHVVGNEHGADESDADQRDRCKAQISGQYDQPFGEAGEKADVFERADDCEHAKEAGDGFEVDVGTVGGVRRDDKRRDDRENERDAEDGIPMQKAQDRRANSGGAGWMNE